MQNYKIEIIRIEPDNEKLFAQIKSFADRTTQGKTEDHIFKQFESKLCQWFGANLSTKTPPSLELNYWQLSVCNVKNITATSINILVCFEILHINTICRRS